MTESGTIAKLAALATAKKNTTKKLAVAFGLIAAVTLGTNIFPLGSLEGLRQALSEPAAGAPVCLAAGVAFLVDARARRDEAWRPYADLMITLVAWILILAGVVGLAAAVLAAAGVI